MNTLFELPPILFAPEQIPTNPNTCLTCQHRERHQCGGSIIQYCAVRGSNRTSNGQLKIKCKTPACGRYQQLTK
jgi:hypothetical protein